MNFGNKGTPLRGKARESRLQKKSQPSGAYPSALQLYPVPPTDDISLEEFEDLAVLRLRVLRVFEKQNLSGKPKYSEDWVEACLADLKTEDMQNFYGLIPRCNGKKFDQECQDDQVKFVKNRRSDHISHFILRLAYCRTEELRRWYVTHETDLFRLRWALIERDGEKNELPNFMAASGLNYKAISREEKEAKREKLTAAATYGYVSGWSFESETYYKVAWLEAMDLVRSRRVYLEAGYAYIPSTELLSLVVGVFRSRLSHNLVLTCRALPALEDDTRLVNMVQNLDKRYTGEDYSQNKTAGRVYPNEIDALSKRNFPLCMSTMQQVLTSTHHIKYKARLQYGLFLKGIGLTLEDAMKFFRSEFTKRSDVDVDKFEKEYAYGIRYNYGKEGKKKNWQPWDCMRIIMENIGPGENHGCPFRHQEGKSVRQRIEAYGIKKDETDAIMKKLEEGHYQIACGMHFSAVHLKDLSTGSVTHPNQWYMESRGDPNSNAGPVNKQGKAVKTIRATLYSNSQSTQGSTQQSTQSQEDDTSYLDDMDDSALLEIMESQSSSK